MIRFSGGRFGSWPRLVSSFIMGLGLFSLGGAAFAAAPSPGGDITATAPGGGATSITEDDAAPVSANVQFTPTTLMDADMGETPDSIRLLSITGGTIAQGDGSAIALGASGTVLMLSSGDYEARFTPSPDRDTDATIQYVVVDPGGVTDSTASTITITITPDNTDPPSAGGNVTVTNTSGGAVSISEDAPAPGAANIRITPSVLSDPDTADDPPVALRLLSVTGGSVAQGDGSAIVLGASGTALMMSSSNLDLRFTPTPDRDSAASISYVVVDQSSVADSPASTATVNITADNTDPPSAGGNVTVTNTSDGPISINEDAPAPGSANIRITPSVLSDPDTVDDPPVAIRLISVTGGSVTQGDGSAITLGASGTVLNLSTGNLDLRFTPAMDRDTDATISYVVVDRSGVTDSSASTATVSITSGADPPAAGGDVTATAPGGGATSITEDDGAPGAANIRVTPPTLSDPDTGETPDSIRLISITGGTVAQSDNSAITLGASGTILGLTGGSVNLRFTPTSGRDTAATISYVVVDPGGSSDSAQSTITVNITPQPDAPAAGGDITATAPGGGASNITEDDPAPGAANIQVMPTTLNDDDTGETPNAIRLLNFTGGTVAQANGSAIVLGASGTVLTLTGGILELRFTPAADRDTAVTIPYVVVDPGGVSDSASSNITVNIAAVNDAPSGANATLADINEDTSNPPGETITNLFGGSFSDVDGTFAGIAVVGNPALAGEGTWQYSPPTSPGSQWFNIGTVTDTASSPNALVLGPTTELRFVPASEFDGPVTSLTIRVLDDSYGGSFSTRTGVVEFRQTTDTSTNGDPTAISAATYTITHNVVGDNDTPTQVQNNTLTVNQGDSGTISSALLSYTDVDDVDTTLQYTIVSGPSNGTLNMTPNFTQGNINGNAVTYTHGGTNTTSDTFTFNVRDDESATTANATFNITINLTPTVTTPIADVQVNENAANTVIDLLTSFTDSEDGSGGLTYTVQSTTGDAVFNGTPMISGGNLTLAYAADSPGTAMVTIRATDSNGAFVEDTFQVSVNDRPVADDDSATTSEGMAVVIAVLTGDNDSDGTLIASSVTVSSAPSNGTTMVNTSTGAVTYTPTGDFNGSDSFQYTVDDNLGSTSAPATVTITVSAVNDPPVLTVPAGPESVAEGDSLTISTAAGNPITITDVDADETPFGAGTGGVNVSISATKATFTLASTANLANVTGNGTATVSFDGTIADTATALDGLQYTPDALVNGSDTITINVSDKGNTGAGGVMTQMDTIAVNIVATNDPPVVTVPGSQTVNEDVSTAIGGISIADPDAGSGNVTVTLSVAQGMLTVNTAAAGGVPSGQITNNGTSTVTLLGTVTQQNATLATLRFQTALNVVSDQSLSVVANDNGNSGGPAQSGSGNVGISITAQNDDPSFTNFPAGAQTVNEDTDLVFSTANGNRITIADIDHQENNPTGVVRATLAVSDGTLTLNGTTGLTSVSGDGTATVQVEGSTTNINTAFNGLAYRGTSGFNGADLLTATLNDLGNTGVGGGGNISMNVTLNVSAINNAPTITVPGAQNADENVNFPFSATDGNAIVIEDIDSDEAPGDLVVTLSVSNGVLTLADTAALTTFTGNGTASISMTGVLSAINAALDGLIYRGNLDFNGTDTLNITANDQGNTGSGPVGTDSDTVSIVIGAVNNPPVLTVPGTQTISEDTTTAITGISVADVDAAAGNLVVTLSVGAGRLAVSDSVTGGVDVLAIGNNNTSSITLTGTLSELNNTLPTLTFTTAQDNAVSQTLTVHVTDQGNTGDGGAQTDQETVALTVTAINDDPVIVVPATQTTNEELALIFSGANGNAITFSDVDVAESVGELRVTLTVTQGLISLGSTAGITLVTGTGSDEATVTFSGTAAAVNTALDGLRYEPNLNVNTESGLTESLAIIVNDQGNTGQGGGTNITASVAINITALNDDPTLTVPGAQSVAEDTPLTFGGTVSVADIDVAESAGSLSLRLAASSGTISLATTADITITAPATGTEDASITFTGTAAAVNAALNGFSYQGNQDFNGNDTIALTLNDLGNTGVGGAVDVVATIPVTVTPVNDPPVASAVTLAPAEPLRNEDLTASYTYFDVDMDPENSTTIRWYRNGELQSAFNNLRTVPMSATVEEEVWLFRVTPNDGLLPGTEVESNSVSIRPVADLQLFIARDPSQVVPGEDVTYTFQVRNLGPSPVTGATVTSTLPPALQNVAWTCGACGTSGTGTINETIDLAAGENVDYVLTARVDAAGTGDLTVSGNVAGPTLVFETDSANNTATDTVPLMPEATLNVTMTSDRAEAAPGDTITYTATVTNEGPSDARGVLFTDMPDTNTTLVVGSVTTTEGTVTTGNTGGDSQADVNIGTLPLGASAEIQYSVTVNTPFPASGMNQVCTRGQFIGEPGNAEVNFVDAAPAEEVCTTINTVIAFTATKVDRLLVDLNGDEVINPGDTVRYTVDIINTGNGGANGVVYSHPAIANGSLITDSIVTTPTANSVTFDGGAVTIDLGSIQGDDGTGSGANEATIVFNLVVENPLPPGEDFLFTQGTLRYDELEVGESPTLTDDPDAVAIEDSDLVPVDGDGNVIRPAPTVTRIVSAPELVVLKSDDIGRDEEKRPGDTIVYTVTIENEGNRGAANLVYRNPFRDNEISATELQSVDGSSPLSDVATSLLSNFAALDADDSLGLSSVELDGSFFALTTAQFNELDTSDARLSLLENSILVNGNPTANGGSATELLLDLGSLNGRNPQFTNGPTITITFSVLLNDVLLGGTNTIRCQGQVESDVLDPVLSDDPETINVANDATVTFVRAIPDINIVPEILTIDFGDQDIDDGRTVARMVEISNGVAATANLTLGFVGLEGAGLSEFVIVSDTEETTLTPGATRFIEVAFDPDSIGNKIASLRIESDDPDDSAIDVNLSGRALDSDIRVTPSTLQFGKRNLLAGASAPQSVSIINDGLGVLTLDSVTLACGPDIFPVMTQERFDALDLNNDGVLTRGIGRTELELAIDLFDIAEVLIDNFTTLDQDSSNDLTVAEVELRFPFLNVTRFEALDTDGTLGLSQAELTTSLRLATFSESLRESFEDFDTAAPVGLDFSEAQQILPDVTQSEFGTLDRDEDGVLSIDELEEQLRLANIATQLNIDFFGLDLNQDSVLSLDEISAFTPLLTPGRFDTIDADGDEEITAAELGAVTSTLANDILADFNALDTDLSGGLTLSELSATCDFEIFSDSGEDSLETAQSRLVRVVFNPSTPGMKVGTLRIEANQEGQGTPIVSKVSLFGTGNRTPRIVDQNPVSTQEDTPVTIILDNLIVDAPLLDFPDEVTLGFQPRPEGANYTREGNVIIPNRNFNGVLFVPVTVRDGDIDSNVWNLRISVARVNDPPTGISLDNTTIMENQVLKTLVGRLRTTDPDLGDLHVYSLVPDDPSTDDDDFIDNEFFSIVADQLVSNVVFDFETRDSYTVLIRSRDPQGETVERAFGITIIDQPNDEDNSVASEVLLNNFSLADSNNDGVLTLEEIRILLPGFTQERFNLLNVETEVSAAELEVGISLTSNAQRLFDNFELADVDEDEGLTLVEARTQVPSLTEAAFRYMNTDGDSFLTPSELQSAILLNGDLSSLLAAFASLDRDVSGQLTYDEVPRSARTVTRALFDGLEQNPGVSQRELQTQVACMLIEDSVVLVQPTGDLLAPPEATLLDVTFNAEVDVNVELACSADDVTFTYDIGSESILITDLAEYFLLNFDSLDADFNNGLDYDEVSFSRIGITDTRFNTIDFDGDTFLSEDELDAAVILSDFAAVLLDSFAELNVDNSTGLSFAETEAAGLDFDTLRYGIVDLNNNGVLTRQELEAEIDLPAYLQSVFTELDLNTDTALSPVEVGARLPGLSATRFNNIDQDRDGFLIPEELQNADDFGKQNPVFAAALPLEGVQKQLRGLEAATFTLPVNNAYRVRATATLETTGQTVQSEEFTFEIRNGVDDNANGYLDDPFSVLLNDGSRWADTVESVNCDRSVVMHYWQGRNIPGPNIEVRVTNPADATQHLDLLVPHGLLNEGEEGILIVAMSCDAESLFTRQQAEALDELPTDLVAGSPWIDISVVVRTIGEEDFTALSDSRLAQRAVRITLNRLSFSPEDTATFYRNSATVVDDPDTGFTVVPGLETWSSSATRSPVSSGTTLTANLTKIGAIVALESLKPPILVTVPSASEVLDLGEVNVSDTVERMVTITNDGGEQLVGTVELRDATGVFSLIGEASYDLAHGETHSFFVRFSPNAGAAFAATLTYSGDGGGLVTASVTGLGIAPKAFGCGATSGGAPFPLGNGLVILLTLSALLWHQLGRSQRPHRR